MMNTDEARKIAEDRHKYMEQFLSELEKETNMHPDRNKNIE